MQMPKRLIDHCFLNQYLGSQQLERETLPVFLQLALLVPWCLRLFFFSWKPELLLQREIIRSQQANINLCRLYIGCTQSGVKQYLVFWDHSFCFVCTINFLRLCGQAHHNALHITTIQRERKVSLNVIIPPEKITREDLYTFLLLLFLRNSASRLPLQTLQLYSLFGVNVSQVPKPFDVGRHYFEQTCDKQDEKF